MVILNCRVIMHKVNSRKTVKSSFSEPDVDVSYARVAFGLADAEICRIDCLSVLLVTLKSTGAPEA
jgi:hypothetical protein